MTSVHYSVLGLKLLGEQIQNTKGKLKQVFYSKKMIETYIGT